MSINQGQLWNGSEQTLVPPLKHITGAGGLAYKVVKFPRWSDENAYVLRFLACFGAMLIELLWENGMVW